MITRVSAAAASAACASAFSTPADAIGYGPFENLGTGKCLAVPHDSSADGIGLIQWTCNSGSEHLRELTKVPGGNNARFVIAKWPGSKCLAIPNSNTANGTQAIQWTCDYHDSDQIGIYDSRPANSRASSMRSPR
ncbi:RICIN domain-containing protein [Streptomyces sp. NPDC001536]|uniref:RICIN domain-containing protein n=1 Tax=Streptomyces sp. NPDC001536 TaxID=3364583 RepID=UPI0036AD3071